MVVAPEVRDHFQGTFPLEGHSFHNILEDYVQVPALMALTYPG